MNPIEREKIRNRQAAACLIEKGIKNPSAEETAAFIRKQDEKYMKAAIRQAQRAAQLGEVPIGCVIVREDRIVGRGYNRRNTDNSTLSHAEITAIRKTSKKLGDWRLEDCTMYVTLEPCQMCAGACVQARIDRVVIGAMNPKAGCAGSILNILSMERFNHKVAVTRGICEEKCSEILSDFFKRLRAKKQDQNFSPDI